MPTNLLSLFSIVDYLVAAIVLALPMARLPRAARTVGMLLATLAVIVHASLIFGMHRGGLDLHFFASLSLAGFGVAAMTLLVNLFRRQPPFSVPTRIGRVELGVYVVGPSLGHLILEANPG